MLNGMEMQSEQNKNFLNSHKMELFGKMSRLTTTQMPDTNKVGISEVQNLNIDIFNDICCMETTETVASQRCQS